MIYVPSKLTGIQLVIGITKAFSDFMISFKNVMKDGSFWHITVVNRKLWSPGNKGQRKAN